MSDSKSFVPRAPSGPLLVRAVFWLASFQVVAASVLALSAAGSDLLADVVSVHLPSQSFWPALKPSVALDPAPVAMVVSGGFSSADVMVRGLGFDARIWLAIGNLAHGVIPVSIGICIALLAQRLLRGDPFDRRMSRAAFATASFVGAGGLIWQLCSGIGESLASAQVLAVTGWSIDDSDVVGDDLSAIGWPLPSVDVLVDSWPIAAALAIAAVGVAIRYGETVTADRAALRRETEGLV